MSIPKYNKKQVEKNNDKWKKTMGEEDRTKNQKSQY